jgi:Flp pilus assembly pilin Flp
MKAFKQTVKSLWTDESAQGATEYILLLVVVGAILVAFKEPIVSAVSAKIAAVTEQIKGFN